MMIKLFYELILGVLWSISIVLHGNSDSCGNDDNDGGGVQNVSGGKDGDDNDDNADDDDEDGRRR